MLTEEQLVDLYHRAKAQCVGNWVEHVQSLQASPSDPKPTPDELKADMFEKIRAAEKAAYAYFCECEVGPERERAYDVYANILYATRVR